MKTAKHIVTAMAAGFGLMGITLLAATNPMPRTLEDQVRHEILMVPYIGVFDNLSYKVDNGVVTLFGQVTEPVRKSDVEAAVKRINGVTAVNDQIEVLPLSRFDDQMPALGNSRFHSLGHLELAITEIVIGVSVRKYATPRKEPFDGDFGPSSCLSLGLRSAPVV